MAIDALPSAPAGDKTNGPRPGANSHKATGPQASHFATALESLLGAGGDGGAGPESTSSRPQAAKADTTDSASPLIPGFPSADLPVPTSPRDSAAMSAEGGPNAVARSNTPGALAAADNALAPCAPAGPQADGVGGLAWAPSPGSEPVAGAAQVQAADGDALAERSMSAPPRRTGASLRAGQALDRAAALRQSAIASQETALAGNPRADLAPASASIDTGATRTAPNPSVRVLAFSAAEGKDAPSTAAASLSTLAFASETGVRRTVWAEPRGEQGPAPAGVDLAAGAGEPRQMESGMEPAVATEGLANPLPSEDAMAAPHWSADAAKETQLRIQDMPGGPLEVRIQLSGSDASVGFSSAEDATRVALADSSAALSELLLQEGIRLVDVSVQAGLGDSAQPQTPPEAHAPSRATGRRATETADAAGMRASGGASRAGTGRLDVFV